MKRVLLLFLLIKSSEHLREVSAAANNDSKCTLKSNCVWVN